MVKLVQLELKKWWFNKKLISCQFSELWPTKNIKSCRIIWKLITNTKKMKIIWKKLIGKISKLTCIIACICVCKYVCLCLCTTCIFYWGLLLLCLCGTGESMACKGEIFGSSLSTHTCDVSVRSCCDFTELHSPVLRFPKCILRAFVELLKTNFK